MRMSLSPRFTAFFLLFFLPVSAFTDFFDVSLKGCQWHSCNPPGFVMCFLGDVAGIRWGWFCQVSSTVGQTSHSVCDAVHCSWPKDRLWALAVNICSRDCTICPRPQGEHLSSSQTSCRAPDVDLSSLAEAENTAKTQSEPLSAGTFVTHT